MHGLALCVRDEDFANVFAALHVTEGLDRLFEWGYCGDMQGLEVTVPDKVYYLEADFLVIPSMMLFLDRSKALYEQLRSKGSIDNLLRSRVVILQASSR